MRRAPGWIRLAGIALELTALAYIAYVLMDRESTAPRQSRRPSTPQDDTRSAARPVPPMPSAETMKPAPAEPLDFINESGDAQAHYYRASDETVELLAGFYSDGRVRLADAQHRFAGMLQGGHADLLDVETSQWSELFVRTTPAGTLQLELRGGPHDGHVLTCEPFDKLRMTK